MLTAPTLLVRLQAAIRPLTAAEVRAQRISWVMSMVSGDPPLTRDEVARIVDSMNGVHA